MNNIILKKVSEIKKVDKLYPRSEQDTKTISKYAENLDVLPPIEINQNSVLIDGAHRLSAYKQCKKEEIPCVITQTNTDEELYLIALQRNATHGLQLSSEDKKSIAITLYGSLKDDAIIKALSISESTYDRWTKNKREESERKRDAKIMELWLQCYSLREIEEKTGVSKSTVEDRVEKLKVKVSENSQTTETGQFAPQLYNIWNFTKNNNETKHFGNVPYEIVENLLYAYTEPFDVVFDPFGGGGITIDACKKWYRRYYVSDIAPTEIALQGV